MATSPAISSSFLSAINHHPSRQNPSLLHNHKRLTFKIRAAKLPAGVVLPKELPKFQAPFLGFTRTAEIWNSRACMIGLIGTFIVELILNKGILEVIDGAGMHQLIVVNNCKESIWPGIQGGAGHNTPRDGGLLLTSGQEVVIDVPEKWSGRIWGRQGCNFDANGKGSCATGDCAGQLHCRGQGGEPPATVVEMTLGSPSSALHFYDVSLVDGFNLPVSMKPVGGGIGCGVASCEVDMNVCCPAALEVRVGGRVVGCKSACLAMQSAKYCCTGEYSNPKTCRPTLFAHLFKAICPRAYTYAFDDSSTLNKCRASRYVITFCPPT